MESYTDLDLHLQFVCFFCNERLYIDRSNEQKYIPPTFYNGQLSVTLSLLLNTVTGVNCIQSVFPQSEEAKKSKTITDTKQYRKN